ncbi:MAG: hypothetical protein ACWA6U_18435 [Breznakibacter sp.]
MGIIKKYSYVRALIIGVPFGLVSLISGIKLFGELPKLEDLIKEEGEISEIKPRIIKDGERIYDFVEITLENGTKYSSGEYKVDILNFFEKQSSLDKNIIIWHEQGQDNIRQIVYGDILIIEYKPPYWIALFFLCLGLVTLSSALVYLIKHPEDFRKNRKGSNCRTIT